MARARKRAIHRQAHHEVPSVAALRRAAEGEGCKECGCTESAACPGGCAWDPGYLLKGELVCTACTDGF